MNNLSALPSLDLFTVKVMALITVVVVSLATLLGWRLNRRVAGIRLFAMGMLSIASGSVLGLARVLIRGDAVVIACVVIACNVLMVGGMIAVVQGIRGVRGFPALPHGYLAVLTVGACPFFFYWLLIENSFGKRVGVISLIFVLLSIDAAASLFRRVPTCERLIYWPTAFAFVFVAGYQAMRTVGGLSGWYGANMLSPVPIELASTMCASVAYIACAFGILLASNTQLRYDAERMAQFDPLTDLPNRRFVLDRLLSAERRAVATGGRLGVVYLDLDGFKRINDTLGHDSGDDVLRKVSAAMAAVVRADDCVGRMGGDEFLVVAESIGNRDDLMALAERLRSAVEGVRVTGDLASTMRVSCGAALFPEDARSAHDAMREADAAMYDAKRASRMAERTEQLAVSDSREVPLQSGFRQGTDAAASVH